MVRSFYVTFDRSHSSDCRKMAKYMVRHSSVSLLVITLSTHKNILELELLGQGPSGRSHFHICLGKGTGNRAKGLERVYMTSYSTLMVIMALSASVSKLQACEICLTSILTSPGHSRSKPAQWHYLEGNPQLPILLEW